MRLWPTAYLGPRGSGPAVRSQPGALLQPAKTAHCLHHLRATAAALSAVPSARWVGWRVAVGADGGRDRAIDLRGVA